MAINDFVRRSMQIVAGGIKDSTVDYFDNAITFVNDAKEIKDQVMQGARSSKETFDNMRHAGIGKKFRDWFYNEGGMFGDFDFSDEDFDAGFEIDSADNDSKESSKPLTQDDMQDVAKKQTGAIYKALGKTADLHMANTAEIISTINSRSAELTASVNNINNTLIQIGKRLDMIVEYTTARTKQEQKEERKNSIFDYGGGISVSGLATGLKESANDSMVMSMLSMGKTMLSSGMMTPEMVLSMVLSQTVLDKKFKGLGDKSINDIGEALNDTIGNAIQDGLTKVLTTKNDFLSEIFSGIINGPGKKNFRDFAQNQYNDKPAVFDGMTRKSIVTIIPGYLNEILKAVSHTDGMSIDKKGNLTSKKTDHFINEVADNLFKPGSIDSDRRNKILTTAKAYDANISSSDISEAMRALTGAWLWYMYQTGRQVLEVGETTDITRESTQIVIQNASMLLSTQTGRSSDYWKEILQYCIFQLDESSFRRELQKNNQKAFKNLSDFAKNRDNNSQARSIGKQEILDAYKRQFSMYHSEPGKAYEPPSPAAVTETSVGSSKSTTLGSLDYLSGIFKILNRGLNVYVTGSSRRQKKAYDPIDIKPGDGYVSSIGNLSSVNNNTDITPTQQSDPSTSPLIESDSVKKEPETEEEKLLATPDDELSPEDLKRKRKLMKGKRKEKYNGLKERYETWKNNGYKLKGSVINPWNFLDDIISPEAREAKNKAKEKYDEFKESETGQKILNSEVVKTTKNLGSFISDKIFGKKTTDEEGESTRSGGLLSGIASQASKIKSDMSGAVTNISDKFASKEELQNRFTNATKPYMDESTTFASAEDREDQNTVKILNMTVQTAISDGDYSSVDKSEVTRLINRLHDSKLKQQMKRSIVPLLEKQGKKMEGIERDKPKSGIGKFIGLALVGIKKIFGPVVKIIRSGVTKIFSLVKNFGKKLFSLIGKSVKSGFQKMYYGAKSFGSGVSGLFKSMTSGIGKRLSKMIGQFDKIKNKWSEYQEKRQERKRSSQSSEKTDDKVRDKIRQSEFGKGFLEAYDNRKKANLRDKAPETVGDQAAVDIRTATEDIEDVINNETDEGKGFTRPIIKVLNNIIEAIKGDRESEQEGEITTDTDVDSDKVQDPDEKQKNSSVQMDDLDMNAQSTDLGSSGNTSKTEAPQMADISESSGANNAGGDGKKKGGIMNNIGKMVGGISSMMGGLLQVVLSIVMSLEGFKAIYDLIMTTLTSSLKPLNKAFQMILKVLKPFVKELGSIMKMISEFVVEIVNVVVDIIQPILQDIVKPVLEALSPVLDILMETMTPILSILGIVLKVILAPWFGIIKHTLVPIIRIIGDAVQIIMGVLQIGLGGIMTILGTIGIGIGGILSGLGKLIPIVGDKISEIGGNISDSAHDMQSQGLTFMKNGAKSTLTGAANMVIDAASIILPSTLTDKMRDAADNAIDKGVDKAAEVVQEKVVDKVNDKLENGLSDYIDEKTGKNATPESSGGGHRSTVVTTYGSGDISNSWIYNTYGGEYQRGMGGYLNMDQRGCGPIALADAYNRRGGNLSARSLAASMAGSGAYDPNRGTSVGSFMSTSKSLGMNVRAGGVTQQSLKLASPNNPITVIGSGSDYGTRRGNNHFMNVIGTDSHGGAYVSNPLTGRVDRKPASTIAGSSVVGIYGAGDDGGSEGYTFPDAVKEAFSNLKEQANKILGLFSMEKSDEEEVNDIIDEAANEEAKRQAKAQLGDEKYKEYEAAAEAKAFEDYKKSYPKRDGQSDEEYQAAFQKWYSTRSAQYLAETELFNEAKEKGTGNDSPWQTLLTNFGSEDSEFFKTMDSSAENVYSSIKSMSNLVSSGGTGGTVTSSISGAVMTEFGTPKYTDLDATDFMNSSNHKSGHSIVHSFFGKMANDTAYSSDGNWYIKRTDPTKDGEGQKDSSPGTHYGIDINFSGGSNGKPLYAITGGKVVRSEGGSLPEDDSNGGCGNNVQWQDSGGYYHWYMHMRDDPLVKVGDEIKPGQQIGYVGDTGGSRGAHLHYSVNKTPNAGKSDPINPLLYWDIYDPNAGSNLVGDTNEQKIWAYLIRNGATPETAAGFMGNWAVESGNDPDTLEGYYYWTGGKQSSEVQDAFSGGNPAMDNYVKNLLFPKYVRDGVKHNESGYMHEGHYYPGIGLAQWTGPRTDGLIDYANENGLKWNDLRAQLNFWKNDMSGAYSDILSSANEKKTAREAAAVVMSRYEGIDNGTLSSRQGYADQIYNTYKDADITQWTGYTDTSIQKEIESGKTTNRNKANISSDISDIENRKSIYIKAYQEAISMPISLSEEQTQSIFRQKVHSYGITDNQMDEDGVIFTSDPGMKSSMSTNDWKFTAYAYAKKNSVGYLYNSNDESSNSSSSSIINTGIVKLKDPSSWLNLRSQPDAKSEELAHLNHGTKLDIIDDSTDGWFKVSYDGKEGYASKDFVNITGSGDMSLTGTDFWNYYMGDNSRFTNYTNAEDIPDINESAVSQYADDSSDNRNVVFNRYNISPSEDKMKEEQIRAILQNTYNVRSESIESLLMEILEYLKKKDPKGTNNGTNGSTKLFDERIPTQVAKLSVG